MTHTKHPLQKISSEPYNSLSEKSAAIDNSSARLVNVVIVVLLVVAFLPALLDHHFYESMPRFILGIVLGALYGLIGTSKLMQTERLGSRAVRWLIYFGLQLAILIALFILGREYDNNYWLLMLPLSAQATAMGWSGTLLISVGQLFLYWAVYWIDVPFANYANGILSLATGMLFTVLFTVIAFREQAARIETERLAKDLRMANYRLAEYAAQVEELATIRERNRLAREIHDNLGHYLTVVNVQIEAARTIMDANPERSRDALNKAQKLTQDGLAAIRRSVSALRESPLVERPLPETITQLVEENQAAGITTTLTVTGTPRPIDAKTTLTLYRMAQESLTNVRKHAQASHVDLTLDYENEEMVQLRIQDNGVGSDKTESGFGLLGLQERVQLLNGTLTVETEPGSGFILMMQIPTRQEDTT